MGVKMDNNPTEITKITVEHDGTIDVFEVLKDTLYLTFNNEIEAFPNKFDSQEQKIYNNGGRYSFSISGYGTRFYKEELK